jgi:hypothetical protein
MKPKPITRIKLILPNGKSLAISAEGLVKPSELVPLLDDWMDKICAS